MAALCGKGDQQNDKTALNNKSTSKEHYSLKSQVNNVIVLESKQSTYQAAEKSSQEEDCISEISCSEFIADNITYVSSHDSLTGLINRSEFDKRLQEALYIAKRDHISYGFCYLDIDQFKIINESVGHQAGDELIKQMATSISQILSSTGIFARLGGDEFGILLKKCSQNNVMLFAKMIISFLSAQSFAWHDHTFNPSVSIGVVMLTAQTKTCSQLLSHADLACYLAKDLGGNQACLYHRDNTQLTQRQHEIDLISDLNSAINEQRFSLGLQRIMRISSTPEGAKPEKRDEILLRLNDRNGNSVSPALFISAAERFNMMPEIDLWVIQTVLHNYQQLSNNVEDKQVVLNINISGNTLNDAPTLNEIYWLVKNSNVPPQSFVL